MRTREGNPETKRRTRPRAVMAKSDGPVRRELSHSGKPISVAIAHLHNDARSLTMEGVSYLAWVLNEPSVFRLSSPAP